MMRSLAIDESKNQKAYLNIPNQALKNRSAKLLFHSFFKGILSPRAILTYMMYFDPLITKNTFFFSKNVIFDPKFAFFRPILPISRTSCQEKSATTLSGKKCYSCQNLSVKYRYSPNLVRKKVLLQSKLVRKNLLLAQTRQEKNATQLKLIRKKMLLDLKSIRRKCYSVL